MEQSLEQAAYDAADLFLDTIDLKSNPNQQLYRAVLDEVEKGLLKRVMKETRNNQQKAAAILGINRATVRMKLKRHGIL